MSGAHREKECNEKKKIDYMQNLLFSTILSFTFRKLFRHFLKEEFNCNEFFFFFFQVIFDEFLKKFCINIFQKKKEKFFKRKYSINVICSNSNLFINFLMKNNCEIIFNGDSILWWEYFTTIFYILQIFQQIVAGIFKQVQVYLFLVTYHDLRWAIRLSFLFHLPPLHSALLAFPWLNQSLSWRSSPRYFKQVKQFQWPI